MNLKDFFSKERWEAAIQHGVVKGINKGNLRELTSPSARAELYLRIKNGAYEIAPPHQALIPKDDGTFRTVYVNEDVDRIFLSIANDMLFEKYKKMVHPCCKSYQKGIGCGKIVRKISKQIAEADGAVIGFKSDLSKYFDSVPIEYIDAVFDKLEQSPIVDVLRKYYHSDLCFDPDGKLIEHYQSLKQGCAVAAFLADVILYHVDEKLSALDGNYVRYSDDILFVGPDYKLAMEILENELEKMSMKLNPKKVQYLSSEKWFTFLGYSIKGDKISLSGNRLKTFEEEIRSRTVDKKKTTPTKALNAVNRYLYKGNGDYAWAEQMLGIINVEHDIDALNKFVMDSLRAVETGESDIGKLSYTVEISDYVVSRGKGSSVKHNRNQTEKVIDGYKTLRCMRNALLTDKAVYKVLTLQM